MSIVDQIVRMAMCSFACHRGGCKSTLHKSAILDIPWIPKEGSLIVRLAGIMAQVPEYRPRAFIASTFLGKRAELLPVFQNLNGFPEFHLLLYLEFLGDPNRFTGYQPRIARLVQFLVSEGCRDPCVFC